jgi:hypothetical protein
MHITHPTQCNLTKRNQTKFNPILLKVPNGDTETTESLDGFSSNFVRLLCHWKIFDNILEQVSHFNYLGIEITYMQDKDIHNKLNKFSRKCGTLRRILKIKTRKTTQMKFYKVMALPALLYGSET